MPALLLGAGITHAREADATATAPAGASAASEASASPATTAPGRIEGQYNAYLDDQRLYVNSVGGELQHPLFRSLALKVRAVADWITILPSPQPAAIVPQHDHAVHEHTEEDDNPIIADAISGASARIGTANATSREVREEGMLGLVWYPEWHGRPTSLDAEIRASHEPDYASLAAVVSGQAVFLQGNTTVSAFLALDRDEVSPSETPAGQKGLWPAMQSKSSAGFSASQTLASSLILSGGLSAALQTGTLASPYRNALVDITFYPERLPRERLRSTAYLQAALYLGWGSALHLRQGLYRDDWGVTAWIPEAAIAKQFGSRALLTLKHRFYAQSPADFYRAVYPDRKGYQTGDVRLGTLFDQVGTAELEYSLRRATGRTGPILLTARYTLSHLEYPELHPRTLISHVFSLSTRMEY